MSSTLSFDLVVLDLDGTVQDLFHAGVASPRVRAAMAAVQANDIPLTLATGRTLDYIRANVAYLHITPPVIATHGSVIGDPQTGKIYAETPIPMAVAQEVAAWLDASTLVTALYINDTQGHICLYQNRRAQDAGEDAFHSYVFGEPRQLQPQFLPLLTTPQARPPLKFLSDNDPSLVPDVLPELLERFGDALYLTRSHPRLVEGMARGVHKGQGLLQLCELLGIDPQRVLAIGDNDNDIPLLQMAGFGVAMGNGTPGLKAVADWIAPTIEDDGAAVALEQLVLNKR